MGHAAPGGSARHALAMPSPGAPRLRSLVAILAMALLTLLLVRFPLTAVPSYESGVAVGAAAFFLLAWTAARRAQGRPAEAAVRWGVLESTPLESVLHEARAGLRLLAVLAAVPLPALLSVALRSECRAFVGLGTYAFVAIPAGLAGIASGALAGSITRSRWRAALVVAALVAWNALDDLAELLRGPRIVLHDAILGPLTASAYTGYDTALTFPPSVAAHRAWSLLLWAAVLVLAAWIRSRRDAPARREGERDVDGRDAWQDSRADDGARARFLLAHHRRALRLALAACALLALPFALLHDRAGITSGRSSLRRELSVTLETEHFRLHLAPGSAAEAHVRRIGAELEWSFAQATSWLRVRPQWRVDAWLHGDADSMFRLTGARGFLFAKPWRHEFHVLASGRRVPALRHELVHVLVADSGAPPFGASLSMGMTEGLATALDEGFSRTPEAHAQVAAAARAGLLPHARDLVSLAGFAKGNMDRSYRAAGSFVGWLLLAHGPEVVLDAYATASLHRATGEDLGALDRQWRAFLLEDVPVPESEAARGRDRFDPARRPAFHRMPCARLGARRDAQGRDLADLLASEGLADAAADAYCEVPGWAEDPAILEAAATQRLRQGRRAEALALTESALARLPEGTARRDALSRQRIRLLEWAGRLDDARAALAAWRDERLATFDEERQLEQEALDSDAWRADYVEAVLAPPGEDVRRLSVLVARAPGFTPALHQLVARLQGAGATDDRVRATLELARRLPGPMAARRLLDLARTLVEEQRFAESADACELALELPLEPLQRLEAEDLLGTARFAAQPADGPGR